MNSSLHIGAKRRALSVPAARPLREDIRYRAFCIELSHADLDQRLPPLMALAAEARNAGDRAAAALILKDLAWTQSEAGDIAGAFANFEAALADVPDQRGDLLGEIMLDTATTYIVNGDTAYIHKGIALLRNARQQMAQRLADPDDSSDKAVLKDDILLTHYNEGIAYLLHLADPTQALAQLDLVAREPNSYRDAGLSFASLAAAELGQFDRAKRYAQQASGRSPRRPPRSPSTT